MIQGIRGNFERLSSTQQAVALAILAFFVALGLRSISVVWITPGFHTEEATQGLYARQIGEDLYPMFFGGEIEAGEPAFPYLLKGMTILAGEGVLQARIVTAFLGSLVVMFCTLWLYRAFGSWWWGVAAAALAATSFWQLIYSGQALPGIAAALTASAGLWCLRQAMQHGALRGRKVSSWCVAAGFAFGLSIYTHVSGLIVPVLVLVSIVPLGWTFQRRDPHFEGTGLGIVVGVMLLTMAPLASFYIDNPAILQRDLDLAGGLPAQLTEGRSETAVLLERLFWNGASDAAVNLPGRPIVDPILAVWGLVGLVAALARPVRPVHSIAILWLVLPIVPIALLDPNDSSLLLALTPAFIALPLIGMRAVYELANNTRQSLAPVVVGLIVLSIAASGAWSLIDYFGRWADDRETYVALRGDLRDALNAAENLPDDGNPLYIMAGDDERVVRYLAPERTHSVIETSQVVPIPQRSSAYLIAPSSSGPDDLLVSFLNEPIQESNGADVGKRYSIWFLDVRTRDNLPRSLPVVTFTNGWRLDGHTEQIVDDAHAGGPRLGVVTVWRVPLDADPHNVEIRLEPAAGGPARSSRQLVQPWKNNPLGEGEVALVALEVEFPASNGAVADLQVALHDLSNTGVPPSAPEAMIVDRIYALLNRLSLASDEP